jgi:hypothetical protein
MTDKKVIALNGKPVATADEPTAPIDGEVCGNCFHWKALDKKGTGQCLCNPPQVVVLPQQDRITGQMSLNVQSIFPPVTVDMRCGLFEPLIPDDADMPEAG